MTAHLCLYFYLPLVIIPRNAVHIVSAAE